MAANPYERVVVAGGETGGGGGGQVEVTNFPASQDVEVTNFPATQPVSGPLTNTELRATAVPVSVAGVATETTLAAAAASMSVLDDWDNGASDGASVSGDVAHGVSDAGEPVKIGYKAIAHGASPSPVAANDRTNGYANRHGIPWVIGGHPNIVTIRANYAAAQTNVAIVSANTGEKIVVTRCSVLADKANTVDVSVVIGFGASTTPTGVGVVLAHPGIAAGSGVVEGAGSGMLGVGADAEDLRITSEVPTTGSIDVVVSYYIVPS